MTRSHRPPWRPVPTDALVAGRDLILVDPTRATGAYGPLNPHTTRTTAAAYPTSAAIAESRRYEHTIAYARWAARQAEIRATDVRARRFWLAAGATVGLGILATLAAAGWWLYHTATSTGPGALLLVLAVLAGLALAGGHRCVTTITHRH